MTAFVKRSRDFIKEIVAPLHKESTLVAIVVTLILSFMIKHDIWRPRPLGITYHFLLMGLVPVLAWMALSTSRSKGRSPVFWAGWGVTITSVLLLIAMLAFNRNGKHLFISSLRVKPLIWGVWAGISFLGTIALVVYSGVDLRKIGLGAGRWRWWLKVVGISLLLLVPLLALAVQFDSFKRTYPLFKEASKGIAPFLSVQIFFFCYFFTWEFLFRGFLLNSLERSIGPLEAIVFQMIPFAIMHYGKPELELYSSVFGGMIIGWVAWRSKSIYPCVLLHWLMAAGMDVAAILAKR